VLSFFAADSCLPRKSPLQFFAEVENLCPRLSRLHLFQTNLLQVTIGDLPSSLESLAITSSLLESNWFQPLSVSTAILPHLKKLDLSGTTYVVDDDVGLIARTWLQLRSLKLNYTKVTDKLGVARNLLLVAPIGEIATQRTLYQRIRESGELPPVLKVGALSTCPPAPTPMRDNCQETVPIPLLVAY